ncbi:hypothetical protein JW906_05880 [bacterium]|nr:hypothetical protein [bacterium]
MKRFMSAPLSDANDRKYDHLINGICKKEGSNATGICEVAAPIEQETVQSITLRDSGCFGGKDSSSRERRGLRRTIHMATQHTKKL